MVQAVDHWEADRVVLLLVVLLHLAVAAEVLVVAFLFMEEAEVLMRQVELAEIQFMEGAEELLQV